MDNSCNREYNVRAHVRMGPSCPRETHAGLAGGAPFVCLAAQGTALSPGSARSHPASRRRREAHSSAGACACTHAHCQTPRERAARRSQDARGLAQRPREPGFSEFSGRASPSDECERTPQPRRRVLGARQQRRARRPWRWCTSQCSCCQTHRSSNWTGRPSRRR